MDYQTQEVDDELRALLDRRGGEFVLDADQAKLWRSNFEAIYGRLKRHRTFAKNHLYDSKTPDLEVLLLSDTSLNAFAYASRLTEKRGPDIIGLNVGVVFTLLHAFNRLLSHPQVFPDVGSSRLERWDIPPIPFLSTDVITSDHEIVVPQCPIRAVYAGELAQVAIDFLFFHELTHLRNGHVDYLRQRSTLSAWEEAFGSGAANIDMVTRQTLELDADCGGILQTLSAAFRLMDLVSRGPNPNVPAEFFDAMGCAYGNAARSTRTVHIATYVLFRLFDVPEWIWWRQPNMTHPLPPVRMFFIGPTLHEIFRQRPAFGQDADAFVAESSRTMLEVEEACGLIQGRLPNLEGIYSVVKDKRYLDYIAMFSSRWGEIRSELNKYKRGGVLAGANA